ncbi:DUF6318 family protein [Sanguibacter antarcticus]|nr:DUF6318 family protein [Sanguibacter antarcticus]
MTLPRALRSACVGGVLAYVALAGCTPDDNAPAPTTSVAATEEPISDVTTAPAEVLPPEKPTLMTSNDAIGARAAAEYFLSLYGYVFQTGDLAEWDAMCDPESEFCNGVRDAVDDHVASGNVQSGGSVAMSVDKVIPPSGALEEYEVTGRIDQESYEIVDSDGALLTSVAGDSELSTSVFLKMDESGSWRVRAVVIGAEQ